MLNVALTGNIAAGKSSVVQRFERWGATVIDADQLVREVQAPGSAVLQAIVERFGVSVLDQHGALDRARMRAIVVEDAQARTDLNAIVHPAVRLRRAERHAEAAAIGDLVVINDIPLLFEAADPSQFDYVIVVDAPLELRRERLIQHRHLDPVVADQLIASQLPADAKRIVLIS